jgi:hypothetical protein
LVTSESLHRHDSHVGGRLGVTIEVNTRYLFPPSNLGLEPRCVRPRQSVQRNARVQRTTTQLPQRYRDLNRMPKSTRGAQKGPSTCQNILVRNLENCYALLGTPMDRNSTHSLEHKKCDFISMFKSAPTCPLIRFCEVPISYRSFDATLA